MQHVQTEILSNTVETHQSLTLMHKYIVIDVSIEHLDDDAAFVVAQRHVVGASQATHTPHTLHAVVQRALQTVCTRVPDTHSA